LLPEELVEAEKHHQEAHGKMAAVAVAAAFAMSKLKLFQ
jgi:hypothetical protein